MPKDRQDQELPDTDPRFLRLIDSTLDLQSSSVPRGYFTNPFSGESKVSYLPPDCEGNAAWQLRWQQMQRNSCEYRHDQMPIWGGKLKEE